MITKMDVYKVIPKPVLKKIIHHFELNIDNSLHGIDHWARVLSNGIDIAENNGANKNVIIAFSFFHDIRRQHEAGDPEHGLRGAKYLQAFKYKINLTKEELNKAMKACAGHTDILHHEDIDIASCWDADRLDLYRVGVKPDPHYLNSDYAKKEETIKQATKKSWDNREEWLLDLIEDLKK